MHTLKIILALACAPVALVNATPPVASMVLMLEVDGPPPPVRGRYVIQRRACAGNGPPGQKQSVPVALDAENSPMQAVQVAPGCYDVRFESLDRRGVPVEACELGAAAGVAVHGDSPTTVVFVGHCQVPNPPLVN